MNNDWFSIPIYSRVDAFSRDETDHIYNSYVSLKEKNILKNFNGTSSLSYTTKVVSVLDEFNLHQIKEKIRLYCNDYLINCGAFFKKIEVDTNWVIGYNKNQYQGEHNHGYGDNCISGVVYARAPENSSSIQFFSPNPYYDHVCIRNRQAMSYTPSEGMIIIFPSFLKHLVQPNITISNDDLRLGLAFNAKVINE